MSDRDSLGSAGNPCFSKRASLRPFSGRCTRKRASSPVLIPQWMLSRTEVGAGLIKLRHDPCWRDLTCLHYHNETQPLPNPQSWYFHRIPARMHRRFSTLAMRKLSILPVVCTADGEFYRLQIAAQLDRQSAQSSPCCGGLSPELLNQKWWRHHFDAATFVKFATR